MLHPKVVEHLTGHPVFVNAFVEFTNFLAYGCFESAKLFMDLLRIERPHNNTHGFGCNGIDVTSKNGTIEFVGFANCSPATHKRIENGYAGKRMLLKKGIFQIGVSGQNGA